MVLDTVLQRGRIRSYVRCGGVDNLRLCQTVLLCVQKMPAMYTSW